MSNSLVILTGAGVSAESGLPTFRDANGLWEGHRVEEVASPQGFATAPTRVHRFYNHRRAALATVHPNAAHLALARLEESWEGEFLLVTQNVDDLHERAGSRRMLHLHGELLKARCTACGAGGLRWTTDLGTDSICPDCQETGCLRPDIVWFGEMPHHLDVIFERLASADRFLSIGTSGAVYPAAGFVSVARAAGARTWEVNLTDSEVSDAFDEQRIGPASEVVPALVAAWLLKTPS